MKKIAPSVYKGLTPKQRVVACVEALARDDEDERERLIKTCAKKTYWQTDADFSDRMEKLMGLALVVECDLRGCALSFVLALRVDAENAFKLLQPYANIRAALQSTIAQMGIPAESMRKAGPPASPVFELIEDLIPDPDHKETEKWAAEMMELISGD